MKYTKKRPAIEEHRRDLVNQGRIHFYCKNDNNHDVKCRAKGQEYLGY